MTEKQREMASWQRFCKNKIEKIEKVWNRKLDERRKEDEDTKSDGGEDDDDENDFEANMRRMDAREKNISEILANMPLGRRGNVDRQSSQSFVAKGGQTEADKDIAEAKAKAEAEAE